MRSGETVRARAAAAQHGVHRLEADGERTLGPWCPAQEALGGGALGVGGIGRGHLILGAADEVLLAGPGPGRLPPVLAEGRQLAARDEAPEVSQGGQLADALAVAG